MKEIEKLLNYLKDTIEKNNDSMDKMEQNFKVEKDSLALHEKELMDIIENTSRLKEYDLTKLHSNLFQLEDDLKNRLEFYKRIVSSNNFKLSDSQKNNLISIFNNLLDCIRKSIENLDYDEIQKLFEKNESLIDLKDKLNHIIDEYLSSEDIDVMVNLLNELKVTDEEKIDIVSSLTIKSINNLNHIKINEEEPKKEIEDIGIILSKYGYSLESFKDSKNFLQENGKCDNVKRILEYLKQKNINVDVNTRGKQFAMILCYSDDKIIAEILSEEMKKNPSVIFDMYLKHASIFIKEAKPPVISGYNNYLENKKYLESIGLPVLTVVKKCGSLLKISPATIKRNIEIYKRYNIDEKVYTTSLSSLSASDPQIIIDKFIELGCFNYLLDNFSKVLIKPDDLLFYNIMACRQRGKKDEEIFYFSKTDEKTTSSLKGNFDYGIDEVHKEKIVNEYVPGYFIEFDSLLKTSKKFAYQIIIPEFLEYYKIDDLRYDFNGVIISRQKVLKNYSIMSTLSLLDKENAIMYAITNDSILTMEQYNLIESCINKSYKKGV